jgi:DNA-directed RNA polymerase subunit beta'
MLSKIQVQKAGDTDLLPMDFVERYKFRACNKELDGCLLVKESGDTEFAIGDLVEKETIKEANAIAQAEGKAPAKTTRPRKATGKPLLLGITKAALQSESFLSGASFQETTKVLTEAALRGASDQLKGLKENVLLGHLVPCGTGFAPYQSMRVKYLVDPLPTDEDDEDSMLSRVTQRAEALGAQSEGSSTSPTVQVPNANAPIEAG